MQTDTLLTPESLETAAHGATGATIPEPPPIPLMFDVEELGKKDHRWRLEVRLGDLALSAANERQPYIILRHQFTSDRIFFDDNIRALVLKKPKKVTLKLTPEASTALANWVGDSSLAGFHLKRRYAWVLPVAIFWMLGSLPISGNAEAGVQAHSFDIFALGMGIALLGACGFAKWRPHPILFLVDATWFLALAGYVTRDVVHGHSKFWLLFAAWCLWMVVTGLKQFVRFRRISISRV